MSQPRKKSRTGNVKSLEVTTRILKVLADSGRPVRVTDMANQLNMTKARVSRHLSTLASVGMVGKSPDEHGYRLGWLMFELGQRAAAQYQVASVAEPFMYDMRDRLGEAVMVAIPASGDVIIAMSLRSNRPISPYLVPGHRLHVPVSPSANVLLAFTTDEVREETIKERSYKRAKPRIDDIDKYRSTLAEIRKDYYMWSNDPHNAGFSVAAAPVFGFSGNLDAVIATVTRPVNEQNARKKEIINEIKSTAAEISRNLGSEKWKGHL